MAGTKHILFYLVVLVFVSDCRVLENNPRMNQSPIVDQRLMKKSVGGFRPDQLNRAIMETLASTNPSYFFTPVKKSVLMPMLSNNPRNEYMMKNRIMEKRGFGNGWNDMAMNMDPYFDGI